MESPLDHLKAAVYEEDEEKRIEKIVTGCKLITDALPFEKRIEAIVKIPTLIQYLLLNSIFSINSISMILNSLLDKFRESQEFLEIFWSGLEYCAKLSEIDPNATNQTEDLKEAIQDQSFTQLRQNKYAEYIVSISAQDCNSLIQLNIVRIKYIAISFIHDLYTIYTTDKNIDLDEKNGIFITFLHNSNDEKFILSVVQQIEQIKQTFLFYFHSIMDFDDQIEEVIRTKGTANRLNPDRLKLLNEQSNWESSSSVNSPLIQSTTYPPQLAQKSRFSDMNEIKNTQYQESNDALSDESFSQAAEEKTILDQIEEWMVSSAVPIIGQNEFMLNFFKLEENIELILGFILDPLVNLPTKIWIKTYPRIKKDQPLRDMRAFKLGINPILELEPKVINAIMMRSYKLIGILSERKNLRVVSNAHPEFFEFAYLKIYEFFKSSEQANLYHVGKLIDQFINFSPDYSFYFVMANNLMFNMIDYIYNPQINQVVNGICNVQWNTYKFTEDVAHMVLEYLHISGFITELSALIVQNDLIDAFKRDKQFKKREIIAMQNKILTKRTEDIKYRKKIEPILMPAENLISQQECKHIIQFQMNILSILDLFLSKLKNKLNEVMGLPSQRLDKEYFSMKELIGLRPDIDGIRKIKSMKKISQSEIYKQKQIMSSSNIPDIKSTENISNEDQEEENRKEIPSPIKNNQSNISSAVMKLRKANFRLSFIRMSKKENVDTMLDKNAKSHSRILNQSEMSSPDKIKLKKRSSQQIVEKQQFDNIVQQFSTTNSFSSGKLLSLYPNTNMLMVNSEIEHLSKEKEFFSEKIIQKEMYAIPGSQMCYGLLYEAFNFNDHKQLYELVKLNHMTEIKKNTIFKIFFDYDAKIFQKLIMNYLIKMRVLSKLKDNYNSALETGKVINLILSKIYDLPQYREYFLKIHDICKDVFDFACKTLVYMHSSKRDNFYIQNFKVVNPIGSCKIVLFETICLILKNDQPNLCELLSKISDTTWHVIMIQFFNHPTNTFYSKLYAGLNSLTCQYGQENVLKNVLFKLNSLSSLSNAYDNIVRNSVVMHQWHIDTFLIYIKQIVDSINLYSDTPKFKNIKSFLMQSASWNFLRSELFPPLRIISQSNIYSPTKSNKNQKVHSSINLTLDKSHVFSHAPDSNRNGERKADNNLKIATKQIGTNSSLFSQSKQKLQLPPILTSSQLPNHIKNNSQMSVISGNVSTKATNSNQLTATKTISNTKLSSTSSMTELNKNKLNNNHNNNNNNHKNNIGSSRSIISSAGNLDIKKEQPAVLKKRYG